MFLLGLLLSFSLQGGQSAIVCSVTASGVPVPGAEIVVAGKTYLTDARGQVRIDVSPGPVELTVVKAGFAPVTTTMTVAAGQQQPITIELDTLPTVEETVTISATRTDKRVEDQPMRVEVLDRDDIEEKQLMTPGDIVMMLNEMGGLRVQATSPSLGAASVRVQGMRGRYTRFLSDGLPLFGEAVGGLGLLQIPPTDLGQVEVIKGVASALYGAGALAGVVDLISRRPGKEPIREALVNRTTRGGTDAVLFAAQPLTNTWSGTLLAGGHWQEKNDVDDDGWADLAGYSRAVVRPRILLGQPRRALAVRDRRRHMGAAGGWHDSGPCARPDGRALHRIAGDDAVRRRRRGADARRRPVRADGPQLRHTATPSTCVWRHPRRRCARYVLRRGRASWPPRRAHVGRLAWLSSATHSTLAMCRPLPTPTPRQACLPRTTSICPVG